MNHFFGNKLPFTKSRLQQIKEGGVPPARIARKGSFTVSIHKIIEDPDNERKTFRQMDELTESIAKNGIIETPTVTAEGDVYKIVTGHRRVRAAKTLGLEEIEVIIREPDDAVTRRLKSIISNVQRENIGPVELAEGLMTLLENGVSSQRELASLIGKTEDWVSAILSILRLPAELQEKLGASQTAVSYDSAIKIARCQDLALQKELVEAVLAGETSRGIRQLIIRSKSAGAEERESGLAGEKPDRHSGPLERVYEICDGYTAKVYGPAGEDARRSMRVAVERLLAKLQN